MKTSKGFTLIEVLMSILLLATTSVILYQSWNGSLLAVRKGRTYSTIALLLQKKAVEFELETKDKTVDDIKDEETGDFGSEYADYKWEIKAKPFTVPSLFPKNADGENQNELMTLVIKTLTDYFEKAVREIQITVVYSHGTKVQRHSLSTIYIDYKKELPGGF
ncbi:MAG: prepilin-type N-terminal cleavage/methylation domain-containing protein [Oligoflexia bacterium]|nr:prepilin-type N-terminal cleavage/methylation domain-containing protein [Oligoflexia bacterium]